MRTYRAYNRLSLPLSLSGGRRRYITFADPLFEYKTGDAEEICVLDDMVRRGTHLFTAVDAPLPSEEGVPDDTDEATVLQNEDAPLPSEEGMPDDTDEATALQNEDAPLPSEEGVPDDTDEATALQNEEGSGVEIVHGVRTVKEMREYLNTVRGVAVSDMPNRKAVLSIAEREGVEFPDYVM